MRVVIADDHALLSESLSIMLERDPDIEVVGIAYDGLQALNLCQEAKPDVVLMDLRMPDMDGITATGKIKQICPDTKVLILTSLEEGDWISDSFAAGADGYLLKDTPPDKLITLIRCVYWGYLVMSPHILSSIISKSPSTTEVVRCRLMREEDIQIIRLISEGKSNNEIADIMNFAVGTVKNKITRIIELSGTDNKAQLVLYALRNNLI